MRVGVLRLSVDGARMPRTRRRRPRTEALRASRGAERELELVPPDEGAAGRELELVPADEGASEGRVEEPDGASEGVCEESEASEAMSFHSLVSRLRQSRSALHSPIWSTSSPQSPFLQYVVGFVIERST